MIPYTNYKRLEKKKDSILNTKIKYLFKEYNFMLNSGKEEFINYKDKNIKINISITIHYIF